jgi:hypothetical protein
MKKFNSLVELIKRLQHDEYILVKKYLTFQSDKSMNKALLLLELIRKTISPKPSFIMSELYSNANQLAFNKLVDRVKTKILDSFLIDSNLKNTYPERILVNFELRKKLIQSDILSQKGLRDDAETLCKSIITKAKQYELFDIITQAYLIRQRFASIRKKSIEVKKLHDEVEINQIKYKSYIKCQLEYISIINQISNSRDKSSYIPNLHKTISEIRNEYNDHNSKMAYFYLNLLETDLYQKQNNYENAEIHLNILNTLLNDKAVYSSNQKGTILLNISSNNIHLGNYSKAIVHAEEAKNYFFGNKINTSLVYEQLFYAYFYSKDYFKSNAIVEDQIRAINIHNLNLNVENWKYFKACIQFNNHDFTECLSSIDNISDGNIKNEDLRINKRLVKIMCYIELNEYERAENMIENIMSYIKRIKKMYKINKRYLLIVKLFVKLSNSRYDFNGTFGSRKKDFVLLSGNDLTYGWKRKDAELIPFHTWFLARIKG